MARIARIALEGIAYHVTQRGNARQQVFFDDADHQLYLDLLTRSSDRWRLQVHAWCLMPNHVHLIVVPECPGSMASALGRTHADFARHFNLKHRACGHVWQARYFSCPLDHAHLWRAMAYIERNPIRAGLACRAEEFMWSSAAARMDIRPAPGLLRLTPWCEEFTPVQWMELLNSQTEQQEIGDRLADASLRGRPLGDKVFLERLEERADRVLRARPAGRKRRVGRHNADVVNREIGV